MKKSERNHGVLYNFILHITHCSSERDLNYTVPIPYSAGELYACADEYIREDHVDGLEGDHPIDLEDITKLQVENALLMQVLVDLTSGPTHMKRVLDDAHTLYLSGDDPMTCPRCCSRTDFDILPNHQELHTCIRPGCSFVFLSEADTTECPTCGLIGEHDDGCDEPVSEDFPELD